MEEQAKYGKTDITKLVWSGPLVETDEGREIHGVVGRTRAGEFSSGICSVYHERGPYNRIAKIGEHYTWHETPHTEKKHAIFAAMTEVQKQQSYDRAEPDRLEGETHKLVDTKESFLNKLLQKAGPLRVSAKSGLEQKRSKSIDR